MYIDLAELRERIREMELNETDIEKRMLHGSERFAMLETQLPSLEWEISDMRKTLESHNQHIAEVTQILKDIKEILTVFSNLRGAINTMSAIGSVLKWIAGTLATSAALWLLFKGSIRG